MNIRMENMKKNLRNILVFVLILVISLSFKMNIAYGDSTPSSWAESEINDARSKNLVIGDADRNYQDRISRELFCKLIVNMVEETSGASVNITIANPFNDTNNEDILKAYQMEIVNGVSATRFSPDAYITREQVAAMMMRAARKLDELKGETYTDAVNVSGIAFADENEISSWALKDIKEANVLRIMNGVGGNRINPKGNTTVEQSILLISRVFNEFELLTDDDNTVVNTNNAPIAKADPVEFNLNEQQTTIFVGSQFADDIEGDSIDIIEINGVHSTKVTSNGIITLMEDGRISYKSNDITNNISENFTITVTDGSNTTIVRVRLNISGDGLTNNAPIAKADPFEAPQFLELQVYDNIRANSLADDADNDTLTIIAVNGRTGTINTSLGTAVINSDGTIKYTSRNVETISTETIEVTISDGIDTVVVNLLLTIVPVTEVAPEPISPTIEFSTNEGESLSILVTDIAADADGDQLTITNVTGEQYGTVTINNVGRLTSRFTYISDDITLNRTETLKVTVTDGENSIDVDVKVNVMEVGNLPPTKKGSGIMTFPVNEQIQLSITPDQIAKDNDGDKLYITNITRTSRSYGTATIFPLLMYNRMDFISDDITSDCTAKYTLTVSDGTDSIDIDINIPIYRVNQAPQPINEDVPVYFYAPGTKNQTIYIYPEDIAEDLDGDDISIIGIYRLDYTNTSYDIPGERLDLTHYGYVYFDSDLGCVKNTPTKDLNGYIKDFYIRVTDGIDTTDIRVSVQYE